MSTTGALVLGLLIGWGVEWIIDWIFWRRAAQANPELDSTTIRLIQTEAVLKKSDAIRANQEKQLVALQERVNALEAEKMGMPRLTGAGEGFGSNPSFESMPPAAADDLVMIDGIGPVIARKLNEAGIYTFRDLGALTSERLQQVLGEAVQRLTNEDHILDQARRLAAERDEAENL